MINSPTRFGEVAPALHAMGWRPIALSPDTKIPAEGGWPRFNREPWGKKELRLACIHHRDAACGLAATDGVLAIDVDLTDERLASRMGGLLDQHVGRTPLVRYGRWPKFVRIYRTDGTIQSRKLHPLEIFCGSGQVAAFGWHKGAGRPYIWPKGSPLVFEADSPVIPMVTDASMQPFLAAALKLLEGLSRERGPAAANVGREVGTTLRRMLRAQVPFHVAAKLLLRGAEEGGRHDAVRAVVSVGYNHGMDADAIERLICRCAPAGLLDHVGDYLDRVLDDFAPAGEETWN